MVISTHMSSSLLARVRRVAGQRLVAPVVAKPPAPLILPHNQNPELLYRNDARVVQGVEGAVGLTGRPHRHNHAVSLSSASSPVSPAFSATPSHEVDFGGNGPQILTALRGGASVDEALVLFFQRPDHAGATNIIARMDKPTQVDLAVTVFKRAMAATGTFNMFALSALAALCRRVGKPWKVGFLWEVVRSHAASASASSAQSSPPGTKPGRNELTAPLMGALSLLCSQARDGPTALQMLQFIVAHPNPRAIANSSVYTQLLSAINSQRGVGLSSDELRTVEQTLRAQLTVPARRPRQSRRGQLPPAARFNADALDERLLTTLARSYSLAGDVANADRVVRDMARDGLVVDAQAITVLVRGYTLAGQLAKGERVAIRFLRAAVDGKNRGKVADSDVDANGDANAEHGGGGGGKEEEEASAAQSSSALLLSLVRAAPASRLTDHLATALVELHSACGSLQTAVELLDAASAHSHAAHTHPTHTILLSLLRRCAKDRDAAAASVLVGRFVAQHHARLGQMDGEVQAAAIHAMCACDQLEGAFALLGEWTRAGARPKLDLDPDHLPSSKLFGTPRSEGDREERRVPHAHIAPLEPLPPAPTLVDLCNLCARFGDHDSFRAAVHIRALHDSIVALPTPPATHDVVVALVVALCRCDLMPFALALVRERVTDQWHMNVPVAAYTALLRACGDVGARRTARELHAEFLAVHGDHVANAVCGELVRAYSEVGDLTSALEVFAKSIGSGGSGSGSGSGGNGVARSKEGLGHVMLFCLARHGDGPRALDVLRTVTGTDGEGNEGEGGGGNDGGAVPSPRQAVQVLLACSRAGMTQDVLRLFDQWEGDPRVSVGPAHAASVVDALGRTGDLQRARAVCERVDSTTSSGAKRTSSSPSLALVWAAMARAYCAAGTPDRAVEAVRRVVELDQGVCALSTLAMLRDAFLEAAMWQRSADVVEWLLELQDQYKKDQLKERAFLPPFSFARRAAWVELDGKPMRFYDNQPPSATARHTLRLLRVAAERHSPELQRASVPLPHEYHNHQRSLLGVLGLVDAWGSCEVLAVVRALAEENSRREDGGQDSNAGVPEPLVVVSGQRLDGRCHTIIKWLAFSQSRRISVRDVHRWHHFDPSSKTCSCADYY